MTDTADIGKRIGNAIARGLEQAQSGGVNGEVLERILDELHVIRQHIASTNPDYVMDSKAACEYLRIGMTSLHGILNSGELRYCKVGGQLRFKRSWLDAYIEARAAGQTSHGMGRRKSA